MAWFSARHRAYPRQRGIPPLVITLLIIAGGLALYYLVQMLFFGDSGTVAQAQLHIPPNNTVYVHLYDKDKFTGFSASPMNILENEAIQSRNTAESYLQFFEDSRLFLDQKTEVELLKSRQHKGEAREILVRLKSGQIWGEVTPSLNPRSYFTVQLFDNVFLDTKNGHFSVNYENFVVKVARGVVRISQQEDGEEVFFQDIGVGQQFSFEGNLEENVLAILTEDPWFARHKSAMVAADTSDTEGGDTTEETETVPSQQLQITIPGKNGTTVFLNEEPQEISGFAPAGTTKVVVNDYALQKFQEGDAVFRYIAATEYENMKEGRNEYIVKAFNADDELLGEAMIILDYRPEGNFKEVENPPAPADEEESGDTTEESAKEEVTGTFKITEPNNGNDYTAEDTEGVDIVGEAPSNAAKVVVNDYALSQFSPGDKTWTYRVRKEFGNMKSGENVYEAQALDASGKKIGETFIKITFPEFEEEGDGEAETEEPEILEPSGTGTVEE